MASSSKLDVKVGKLLDKLLQLNKQRATAKTSSPDEVSQYRHVTLKILQHSQSMDRFGRDSILSDTATLDNLLSTLEFGDKVVMMNIINICLELIGKINTGKRAAHFVPNGTQTLIFALAREYHETSPADDVLVAIHQLLVKIAPKDKKLSTKIRLGQGLPVILYLLRNNSSSTSKNIQPVLQILKIVSANSVNASYLGKNGAVTYLYKVLNACGKRKLSAQKLALDSLSLLLKSKSNSARAVGQGLVPYLLTQFQEWHKLDTKYKHINIRKAILSVLKNITNLKSGRKALLEADGVRILYSTCEELLDVKEMEAVVITASTIMKKCFPKCRLPLAKLSFLTFPLPESDFHILDWFGNGGGLKSESVVSIDDGSDSSVDNDDDISSDEDQSRDPANSKLTNEEPRFTREAPPTRSPDDLFMYQKFFCEQFDIIQPPDNSSSEETEEERTAPIYIPTVESDSQPAMARRWSDGRVGQSPQRLLRSNTDLGPATNPTFITEVTSDDIPLNRTLNNHNITLSESSGSQEALFVKGRTFEIPTHASPSNIDIRPRRYTDDFALSERYQKPSERYSSDRYSNLCTRPDIYQEIALKTRSVLPFTKIAYPEMNGHKPTPFLPPIYKRKFSVLRNKTYVDIERWLNPEENMDHVVYDLDSQLDDQSLDDYNRQLSGVGNLKFNSRFESGNLRKAIQINQYEYDLLLNPDINTDHHHQWFYFEVSNTQHDVQYRFNIINCEKNNSQFNFGMKPVLFSHKEALVGRPYWQRVGSDICYYKNHYRRSSAPTCATASQTMGARTHYTASFCVKFPYSGDVCYLAYHYPYTYSTLQAHIVRLEASLNTQTIYYRNQVLCETLGGNEVPLLTITAYPKSDTRDDVEEMRNRPYIFLSARVHPGESNASWVMKGTIQFLLSDHPTAVAVRNMYIFKIVPMLNPDGVVNGHDRCSLAGEDLNRRWYHPCPKLHPTIYHTKGLLQYLKLIGKPPAVFCDYHGHSRKKNVFMYGCSAQDSWLTDDMDNPNYIDRKTEDESFKHLPHLLHRYAPSFSLSGCSYMVEKSKESTARVVVWRQLRVVRSYTMESTFCGCLQGVYKGLQISTRELEEMGEKFAEVLVKLKVTSLDETPESGDPTYSSIAELACASEDTMERLQRPSQDNQDFLEQLPSSTASQSDDEEEEEEDEDDEEAYDDEDYLYDDEEPNGGCSGVAMGTGDEAV